MANKSLGKDSNKNDNWSLGQVKKSDTSEVFMFLKNLTPAVKPGDENYPYVAYLTFNYEKYSETGLPNAKDDNLFSKIEDTDLLFFEKDELSVHLASQAQDGIRDYIFQTGDPNRFLDLAEKVKEKYPQYNVDCEIIKDPDWSHYTELPGD